MSEESGAWRQIDKLTSSGERLFGTRKYLFCQRTGVLVPIYFTLSTFEDGF